MHPNLLMLVNFLPVDGESRDHTFVSSYGDESGGVDDVGCLMSADDEEDAGSRTRDKAGSLTTAGVDGQAGGGSSGHVPSMGDGSKHTGVAPSFRD